MIYMVQPPKNTSTNDQIWIYDRKEIDWSKLKVWAKNTQTNESKYCTWPWIDLANQINDVLANDNINWRDEINDLLSSWDGDSSLADKLKQQLSEKFWIWKLDSEISAVNPNDLFFEQQRDAVLATVPVVMKSWITVVDDQGSKIEIKAGALTREQKSEIEAAFKNADDFRGLWSKITDPFKGSFDKAVTVIENDPVMDVSNQLTNLNWQIQEVYWEILSNDGKMMRTAKKLPFIWGWIKAIDKNVDKASFDIKWTNRKIKVIFSGYDIAEGSLNTAINLKKEHITEMEWQEEISVRYITYIQRKIDQFKQNLATLPEWEDKRKYKMFLEQIEYFSANLVSLVSNLYLSRRRLEIQQQTSYKLSTAMNVWRPLFETLLNAGMFEASWLQSNEAAAAALQGMSTIMDNMQTQLTDRTIEGSKQTAEIMKKPLMNPDVYVKNVEKLVTHLNEMDSINESIKVEREQNMKNIQQATQRLQKRNVMTQQERETFSTELSK